MRIVGIASLAALSVGAARLGFGPPPVRTRAHAPSVAFPLDRSVDLALVGRGSSIEVSSYDNTRRAHPMFLIDGERDVPSLRWSPAPTDHAPWLHLRLARRASIERVTLHRVDARDAFRGGVRIRASCTLTLSESEPQTIALDRDTAQVTLALHCPRADGVRIAFDLPPDVDPASIGFTELDAWGAVLR